MLEYREEYCWKGVLEYGEECSREWPEYIEGLRRKSMLEYREEYCWKGVLEYSEECSREVVPESREECSRRGTVEY